LAWLNEALLREMSLGRCADNGLLELPESGSDAAPNLSYFTESDSLALILPESSYRYSVLSLKSSSKLSFWYRGLS